MNKNRLQIIYDKMANGELLNPDEQKLINRLNDIEKTLENAKVLAEIKKKKKLAKKENKEVELTVAEELFLKLISKRNKIIKTELSYPDLDFLYVKCQDLIVNNNYFEDNHITRIISQRYIREDLSDIFDVAKDEISLFNEIPNEKTEIHYGNLDLFTYNIDDFTFPKYVYGDLVLDYVSHINHAYLPEYVFGDVILGSLENADNLIMPNVVEGSIDLRSLTELNFDLPLSIKGDLDIRSLDDADKLIHPYYPDLVKGKINTKEKAR